MSIETIKARAEAATPGPWAIARYQHGGGRVATSFDPADRELVADLYHEGDREFLYAARTDVPALLRVAEAARDLIAAGCWGHADHSAERCRAGTLREAVEALEALP